jgi:hypothetical protein
VKGSQPNLPGLDERMQRIARRARTLVEVVGDAIKRRGETWDGAASMLDAAFGSDGRPVSASVLRASFSGAERNYPRLEWLAAVLDDPEVQAALLPPPAMTPEQELAALREHLAKDAPGSLERFDRKARRG